MGDTRKITGEVSRQDLENAHALTGLGVTDTVRAALRKLTSVRAVIRGAEGKRLMYRQPSETEDKPSISP
jgi:hypothetical protein